MSSTSTTVAPTSVVREPARKWCLTVVRPAPHAPRDAVAALANGVDASVPGSVLGTLIDAGLASDVTIDGHEEDVEWAAASVWTYSTTIERRADGARVRLVLEGVDTLATVAVDGEVVLRPDDMFRRWVIDLGRDLSPGAWTVSVTFEPVIPVINAAEAANPLPRADMYETPYNQIRKMACSFGWDWGPATVTCGLWRSAHVERIPVAELGHVLLSATWDDGAHLTANMTVDDAVHLVTVEVRDPATGAVLASAFARVEDGAAHVDVAVPQARRWDVVGRGGQSLYDVEVVAILQDGSIADSASRRVGFRSVEVVQRPDQAGTSFEIHVNGTRVWARGFNWIPPDVLPERVSAVTVRALIEEAIATGANMLRVWGGGVIESAAFYDICDEMGVMVWQDFAFACATYAEDDVQAARVTREVEDAVSRIAHHPSLVLWCGCNENLWGWADWGWQEAMGADAAWGRRLYYETIPAALAMLDPERPYIPGSPFSPDHDAHPNDQKQGTTHHWDTWNELDYTEFDNKHSRFAAEFGWQAPAAWQTLVRALGYEPASADDDGLQRLQKHPGGSAAFDRSLAQHVPHLPSDGQGWHFATQLVQARAIRASIGRFRSLHDSCSGTLWWQLDDCWPALSWSVIDVAGRRKLGWYAAREVMAPRAVLATAPGSPAGLTLVNDLPEPWHASGKAVVASADGARLAEFSFALDVAPDGHEVFVPPEVPVGAAVVIVDVDGERAARWLHSDAELVTPRTAITALKVEPTAVGVDVSVTASGLIRDLCLLAGLNSRLADATVDRQLALVLPQETVTFAVASPGAADVPASQWLTLLAADTPFDIA